MRHFGIIGKPLGHSYSERYFTEKFVREHIDATYHAFAIDHIEHVQPLMKELEGFNVTYPYKEAILPYLRGIDPIAEAIGAVNVVHKGIGYNTDWIGFKDSLQAWIGSAEVRALLLGTGGVSKAIQYALDEMGIAWTAVSREARGEKVIGYEDVDEEVMKTHPLVVNCTPLGMSPYENEMPNLPYQWLSTEHWLYDCIYNPEKTLFLQQGVVQGCKIKNGLEMLHLQAEKAWQIWNSI
jgi:shikimate dehydrogenase